MIVVNWKAMSGTSTYGVMRCYACNTLYSMPHDSAGIYITYDNAYMEGACKRCEICKAILNWFVARRFFISIEELE